MTPSLTMDPPHLVHTGVACMSCCAVAPGKLLRCGGCDSAWYCNIDCQRKHFKEHKPFCKGLRLFHALQADLPPEAWPRTARDFYTQRSNCQRLLEPMLRRPLSRAEQRAILGEAKCSICMRTRAQLAKGLPPDAAAAATTTTTPAAPAAANASANADSAGASTGAAEGAATAVAAGAMAAPSAPASSCATMTPPARTSQPSSSSSMSEAAGAEAEPRGGGSVDAPSSAASAPSDAPAAPPAAPPAAGPVTAGSQQEPPVQNSKAGCDTPSSASAAASTTTTTATTTATTGPATTGPATLSCCPHCHWGWACSVHREAYLAGPHASVCMSYQHMNESQLLTHRYLTATGRLPNYVPDKPRPAGHGGSAAWEPVPAGWAAYRGWRPLPPFDQAMMCLLTKRMSQALTVIQALQHHYTPQQLASKRRLEVHVLGASAFEVPADRIWEEILNTLPPWDPAAAAAHADAAAAAAEVAAGSPRVLHVAFVGPELCDIILEESDGRALQQGTSLAAPPPPPGRELLYSYHLCTYQEFARGRRPGAGGAGGGRDCPWRRPDLAVAFNSGMSESDQSLWAPALEVLVAHGVPVVFTSYNGEEAAADAGVWRAAGGQVTLGPERNPFRALEPIAEPSQIDAFYHQNYYWWCGQATATAGGKQAPAV